MEANGTNPCPFPSNSSNVTDERTTVPDPSNLRSIVISEVSQETHQHLHETSAVVDAAYNRIRQIRRRLAQLTEALPTTLGLRELEQRSDRTISPPLDFQHTPIDRQGVAFSDFNPHSVGSWQMSPIQDAPWNGIRTMRVSQTNLAGDDGSTLLGRRVAVRLATSPVVEDIASVTDQLIQDAGQVYARAHDSVVAMTRGYESGFEQFLPIEGEWMPAIPTGGVSTSAHTPSQSMSQLSPHQSSQRTAFQLSRSSLDSSLDPEWDLGSTHNLVSSERLSLLSNFSVQDFLRPSTPSTSNPLGHSLISDEPLSNALSEIVDPISESQHHLIADSDPAFQGRNYVVHRRYNHNGEELVHNITIDWDEDDSRLMPSPNSSRRYRNRFSNPRPDFDISRTETLESQPTPDSVVPVTQSGPSLPASASNSSASPNPGETPPRRRGWARLDLDGNEISSEEEEEYERSRADNRIRAVQHVQVPAQTTGTLMLPIPSTPPQQEPVLHQTTTRKPLVVLRHDPLLSYPAHFVDPLPMPIGEMVESGKTAKREPILLPRHFIMAGR